MTGEAAEFWERAGAYLAERRQEAGLTQDELAFALGKSRSSVANIETGRQQLGFVDLAFLAEQLGFSLDDLAEEGRPHA